jgi:hypothetical protein
MRYAIALSFVALLAGTLAAGAADLSRLSQPRQSLRGFHELPFPRDERAQTVWASGASWSECGAYCAWGMAGCLRRDAQGRCISLGDACDRYCLKQCRTLGGPLLSITD